MYKEMRGLLVNIYRPVAGPDCTNGGITSKHSTAVLIGEGVPEITAPTEDSPALVLCRRLLNPSFSAWMNNQTAGEEYLHAEPLTLLGKSPMFGGNVIYTSDSRFPNRYPIKVHDRIE